MRRESAHRPSSPGKVMASDLVTLDNCCPEDMSGVVYTAILRGVNFHCNIIDKAFRIVWHNKVADDGRKVGMLCHEFYQRRRTPCAKCAVAAVFSSGKPSVLERERFARLPNGLPRWGEIRAFPIYDERRRVRFVVTIGFDVTERKYGLERQRQYVDALENRVRETVQPTHDQLCERPRRGLTDREMEVLALVADGFTNREISKILSISPHTVKSHVIHIFNRLGVNDRTEAATLAIRLKLI